MEQQDTTPNLDPVELPVASPSAAASPQPPVPAPGPPPSLTSLLPDSAFTELCTLLRCSRADVESAIRASRVDPEEAVAILHAAAPTYVAVKGRFEARKRGDLNGGFCIVADGISGQVLDTTFWVGPQALPEAFQVQASWESVRSTLRQIPVLPERTIWRQLEQLLERLLPPTALNLLFRDPEALQAKTAALKDGLSHTFRVDFVCSLQVERFHRLRVDLSPIAAAPPPESPPPQVVPKGPEIVEIRVTCRPHLDPVKGRPLKELKAGDLVQVVVEETTGLGRLIARVLARTGRVPSFPVESTEAMPSGDVVVRLSISEGVHGVFKMSGDVRIRILPKEPLLPRLSLWNPDSSLGLFFLVVASGLLLLAVILYLVR